MKRPCRFLVVLTALLLAGDLSQAQDLMPTTAPAQNWVSMACSAGGTRLAAVSSYGWIYASTNSGASWDKVVTVTTGPEPQRPWTGVASSVDGSRLVAVANFNPIYISTNGGASWNPSGPTAVWASVAASADGMRLLAVDHNMGLIYHSADGGRTWAATSAPNRRWRSIASSADGTTLAAGTDFGTNFDQMPSIYVSTNSGTTWTLTSAPGQPWQTIASSADGTKLAAGAYGGLIYLSKNSGVSWSPANVPSLRWGGIASSADGTRLGAVAWEGAVYVSGDSGMTWTKVKGPAASWQTVAGSADGLRLFAGIWNLSSGGIYEADLPPALSITPSSGGTLISWPAPAAGYALQQNSNITAPDWVPVSVAPRVAGGQNQIVVHPTGVSCSYRLVKNTLLKISSAAPP